MCRQRNKSSNPGSVDSVKAEIATNRLLKVATGDTGGAKRVTQFLLSLWDGHRYRADLQDKCISIATSSGI
ncbi:MAG: DUF7673 family protein [Sulfuricaulis sp.]